MELPWSQSPCNYASLNVPCCVCELRHVVYRNSVHGSHDPLGCLWSRLLLPVFIGIFLAFIGWSGRPSRYTPVHHPLIKQSQGSGRVHQPPVQLLDGGSEIDKYHLSVKWLEKEPLCVVGRWEYPNTSITEKWPRSKEKNQIKSNLLHELALHFKREYATLKISTNSIKWIDRSYMKLWSISYNKALFHKSSDSQTFQQLRAKSYFGPCPLRALSLAVLWSLCPSERQRISRLMQLDPH